MKTNEEIKKIPHIKKARLGSDGGSGLIRIGNWIGSVIWSNGAGWEHVSVAPFKKVVPTWAEMCKIKDLFFYEDEYVVQFHPPKSEYVNNVKNCLHLWRPINETMPTPPSILVGIKGATNAKE